MGNVIAGRFELVDQIGAGSIGTVWRAFDRQTGRYCAAKLLKQTDPTALVRVIREQGIRLDHPHVLSPYAWAAVDDVVLIATELAHGGSLATVLADHGPLPARFAAELFGQLLSALEYVHDAGLVHRDVKPANILLAATGTARPHAMLADFGIVHAADAPRLTRRGFVVGTPGYLAPEALTGAWPHPSQDLYSAGMLCWQLLTGAEHPPTGPAEFPGRVASTGTGSELWTLVRALVEQAPERRPTATAARTMLTAALMAEPLRLPAQNAAGEALEIFDVLGPPAEHGRDLDTTTKVARPDISGHPD